jgi:hypothetical protein
MGGRKVCWTDHNGQVATCIRDDENCNGCKYMPEPEIKNKPHEYDAIKTHMSEYACMRKQLHNLNRVSYNLKDLAVSFSKTGNRRVSKYLNGCALEIDGVIEVLDYDIDKTNKEFEKYVINEES